MQWQVYHRRATAAYDADVDSDPPPAPARRTPNTIGQPACVKVEIDGHIVAETLRRGADRVPRLRHREARTAGFSGGQSAVHQTLCVLCRPPLPAGIDPRWSPRSSSSIGTWSRRWRSNTYGPSSSVRARPARARSVSASGISPACSRRYDPLKPPTRFPEDLLFSLFSLFSTHPIARWRRCAAAD
jgi:hypothetical protein